MKMFKNIIDSKEKEEYHNVGNVYMEIEFSGEPNHRNYPDFSQGKFKRCIFKTIDFHNVNFNTSIFENCTFENCNFINCIVQLKGGLKFYYCNFNRVNITQCKFKKLHIEETNLLQVVFKDTFMGGCILIRNSYEEVRFEENCNLMDAIIDDNYKAFDMRFSNEKSYTKLNYGTYIGRFNYRKFSKGDEEVEDKKKISLSISNTYMELGGQFLRNNVSGKYGVCFYEGKRAFHRTLTGKRKVLSNIYDVVCGYGEKPSRTFVLSLGLIIIFAMLYMVTGLKTFSNEIISIKVISGKEFMKLFIYSVYFSTVTFATVGYGDIMVVNAAGMVISIIEIIIGVFMIGVWTSTLVRKMTR